MQLHNRYFAGLGGEDTVVEQEYLLLQERGHSVRQVLVKTEDSDVTGYSALTSTALKTVWSRTGFRLVRDAIVDFRPDVLHIHNAFPLLSPSVYTAAQQLKVPVVQTLHNYRLICANGLLMRSNQVCEECVGRNSLPALVHKCYKESLAATIPLAAMRSIHHGLGTYDRQIARFIVLTEFARKIFIKDGFRSDQLTIKPNFIKDPLIDPIKTKRSNTFIYVGKLVPEKGIDLLIQAWKQAPRTSRLLIIGDGPENVKLRAMTSDQTNIEWLGWLPNERLLEEIAGCRYLVLPSRWYEVMPMVLVEALAVGTPAIVPDLGAMPDLIDQGGAGLIFRGGDTDSLAAALAKAEAEDDKWLSRSATARRIYLDRYTADLNYQMLMKIYEGVIAETNTARLDPLPIR